MSAAAASPTWRPLRRPTFRALWIAQFASNTGTWAQTVGAQWLVGDLGGSALQVSLVQTAASLPVFLLVVPAGALGDILDRRRLLLAAQGLMLCGAAGLALLTAAGAVTPWLLLAVVALVGAGQALALPSFQAIQPELVAREEIPQAALLNGANFNVARAVGPALGGALISAVGPAATFALNAASFVAVLATLAAWRRPTERRALGAEHVLAAVVAGARFVRASPEFLVVLARAGLFSLFASAPWALLPVVARGPLGLGADGYGLLLGSVGLGAVGGAFVVPALRARLDVNTWVAVAALAYAAAALVIGLAGALWLVVPALVVAGAAWIGVLSTLNATAQVLLPNWTRGRGLAFYTLSFMGGQALGGLTWGALAGAAGLEAAFAASAAGALLGPLLGLGALRLRAPEEDVSLSRHWPEPNVVLDAPPEAGPVLVTLEWRVDPADARAFLAAMEPVGRARRRTGAELWGLFRDAEDPVTFLETFIVPTWEEHLRQHDERQTVADEKLEARARALCLDGAPPRVRHLLPGSAGVGAPEAGRRVDTDARPR